MNREVLLADLGEASDHLKGLVERIRRDRPLNQHDLELILKDVIRHISRAYNYRNATAEEYPSGPEEQLSKMARPPHELLS
jgi:hypothetical protein